MVPMQVLSDALLALGGSTQGYDMKQQAEAAARLLRLDQIRPYIPEERVIELAVNKHKA